MNKEKLIAGFKWLIFLPAALLGGIVAYYVVWFISSFSLNVAAVNPNSFVGQLYVRFTSNAALGLAIVYLSTYIVPSYKENIAIIVGGFILFTSGSITVFSIMESSYWGIYEIVGMNTGAIVTALAIFRGETELTGS